MSANEIWDCDFVWVHKFVIFIDLWIYTGLQCIYNVRVPLQCNTVWDVDGLVLNRHSKIFENIDIVWEHLYMRKFINIFRVSKPYENVYIMQVSLECKNINIIWECLFNTRLSIFKEVSMHSESGYTMWEIIFLTVCGMCVIYCVGMHVI